MLAIPGVLAIPARAALFECPGENGAPAVVRNRPGPGCRRLLATGANGGAVEPVYVEPDFSRPLPAPQSLRARLSPPLRALLSAESSSVSVPEDLVYLMIAQESRFNPLAVSRRGALGLMQLMPDTARAIGVGNPWDATQNLRGGIRYLGRLVARFSGSLPLAVAAYNAGPFAVEGAGNRVPKFGETRQYVSNIIRSYDDGRLVPELQGVMDEVPGVPSHSGSGVVVIGAPPPTVKGVPLNSAPGAASGGRVMYVWLDARGVEHMTNYKPAKGQIVRVVQP